MSEPDFIATYWIHAGNVVPLGAPAEEASPHDFRARAEAAASAGFRGIGLIHSDLMAIRQHYSFAEMKSILDDNGLTQVEFEFVVGWLEDGQGLADANAVIDDLLVAAQALSARHIKVGPDMDARSWPLGHMIERFAELCARAAQVDCGVVLELMPWSNLATIAPAVAVIEGAGCANGGLLIDIWHMHRGNVAYADIETIPPGLIHHVELNDAAAVVEGSLFEDTINRRLHCGLGAFEVPRFIRALDAQGYRGPVGLEVLSAVERQRPFEAVLNDAIGHARKQYQLARASAPAS